MSKFKLEINKEGLEALMKSPEMQAYLESKAQEVAARAGDGYEAHLAIGTKAKLNRATAFVTTETEEAKKDNLENNTLLRALHK